MLPPHVFVDVTNDMKIAQEELFGSIAPIIKGQDEAEAFHVANDTEYVQDIDCDKVLSDNERGGSRLAQFLGEHNRTNVAFIGGNPEASTSRDRERGFYKGMEAHGHSVPEHLRFCGKFSHDASAQIAQCLLDRAIPPEAIVCANDFMAFGVLDVLRSRGRTAEQCWVLGYDDVQMASWHSFNLTTIRQPSREMAALGAQMLLNRLLDPAIPTNQVTFISELIVRGSTRLRPAQPKL